MGFAARTERLKALADAVSLGIGVCLPPVILELILVSLTGRALSRANISLSILLSIAGVLWINADRRSA